MPGKVHVYAVTNWHVAVREGFSVIRLMRRDGTPDILDLDPSDWEFDPAGHDIAVCYLVNVTGETHRVSFASTTKHFLIDQPIVPPLGVGEDVFMIGRFVDHDGSDMNRPTVRFGNISMLAAPLQQPNGNTKRDTYCLDMHSRSGYSGSPVFVYRTPDFDLSSNPKSNDKMLALLGIHWAQFREPWELIRKTDKPSEAVGPDTEHVIGLSGMTCVAPASYILSLLDRPDMKQKRQTLEEVYLSQFVKEPAPESAPASTESAPPTTAVEGDDQHKERFTALLDAAVGKPKQGG
jgi:hypothetical protein